LPSLAEGRGLSSHGRWRQRARLDSEQFALLLDPKFVAAESELRELETAARTAGREIVVVKAAIEPEIETAASVISQSGAAGMVVGAGPFFIRHRRQLVALAARLAIPATYVQREFAVDGGLMSYGASQTEAYRRAAGYVVRILKGRSPPTCRSSFPPGSSS
jgi:putative tryptophan/tyrosine transport system substrate-binding protein